MITPSRGRTTSLAVLLLLGACSGAGPTGAPTHVPSASYTAADVERIVLGSAEAPAGTKVSQTLEGPEALGQLLSTASATTIDAAGTNFVAARFVEFEATDPFALHSSWAAVYTDARSASNALAALGGHFGSTWLPGVAPGSPGLGEESVSLEGQPATAPVPVVLLLWRRGNLLLHTNAGEAGELDKLRAIATQLATTMDARAR
jgi:hypothetical protein